MLHAREHAALGRGPKPVVVACPLALLRSGEAEGRLRAQAVAAQCEATGLTLLRGFSPAFSASAVGAHARAGLLLASAQAACEAGATRLVWCEQAAEGDAVDLDALSLTVDLALAIARVVTLCDARAQGFVVETPFVDMSDAQLADSAIELDAPLATCWWWRGAHASDDVVAKSAAAAAHTRWVRALGSVGWVAESRASAER